MKHHFPTVYQRCLGIGIDITRERIPVVPAAHYTCGGVVVDQFGASDLPGLYVVGETACTGLHGANRMASNSLLECFVYAHSAAGHIAEMNHSPPREKPASWDDSRVRDSDENVIITHQWQALRRLMWDYVGIVRSDRRLEFAKNAITLMREEIDGYYGRFQITRPLLELRNLAQVAALTVECALTRRESRGLHFNQDHPQRNNRAVNSILSPEKWPAIELKTSLKQDLPPYS